MVEKQGNVASQQAAPERAPAPPQPEKPAEAKKEPKEQETPDKAAAAPPSPPAPEAPAPDVPPPTPPAEAQAKAETTTPPPQETPQQTPEKAPQSAPAKAPVFDLTGTESESNAIVLGGPVIPASQDNRYRNRPPVYPRDAQMRGETGTVEVLIHVTDAGLTGGVDLLASSGSASLDRAAVDAVWKWHFRPALKEGRSVPFDLPFRFEFAPY